MIGDAEGRVCNDDTRRGQRAFADLPHPQVSDQEFVRRDASLFY
jgi:hypothetical protein